MGRNCTKDYTFPGTDVTVEKGIGIWISILGIHRDPEYYPDPDAFDPERFTEEEISKRPPMTYFPFGDGPRICIGTENNQNNSATKIFMFQDKDLLYCKSKSPS